MQITTLSSNLKSNFNETGKQSCSLSLVDNYAQSLEAKVIITVCYGLQLWQLWLKLKYMSQLFMQVLVPLKSSKTLVL